MAYVENKPSSLCLSIATSSAHLEDLAYLDEQQRNVPSRTSLRMPRQNSGSQQEHIGTVNTHFFQTHKRTILKAV